MRLRFGEPDANRQFWDVIDAYQKDASAAPTPLYLSQWARDVGHRGHPALAKKFPPERKVLLKIPFI